MKKCKVCNHPEFNDKGEAVHIDESEPGGDNSDDYCSWCSIEMRHHPWTAPKPRKTVWVVTRGRYEDSWIAGVFATSEAAKATNPDTPEYPFVETTLEDGLGFFDNERYNDDSVTIQEYEVYD